MNRTAITITDRKTLIGTNFNEYMTNIISIGGNNIKITSQLNALNIDGRELKESVAQTNPLLKSIFKSHTYT